MLREIEDPLVFCRKSNLDTFKDTFGKIKFNH